MNSIAKAMIVAAAISVVQVAAETLQSYNYIKGPKRPNRYKNTKKPRK